MNKNIYQNHIQFMLSWWDSNMFYYYYYISKDAINIIRSAFGESGSYGSKIQGKCPVQDSYTRIIRSKRSNVTPIQVLVIKIDKIT